jgi:LCP family protein required for cell wall assembly
MRKGSRPARGRHVAEHHRSIGVRVLRRVVGVVAAVTALALVAGVVAYFRLQGNIDTIDLAEIAGNNRPTNTATADPETNLQPMNILLMGSDTRSGLEDASEFGGTDGDMGGERSDTTLLVHLSADRKSATVASIPRDSMVKIPDCKDPDATLDGAETLMFNSAFSIGGPACTVKAVEQNTRIPIDHFAVVNFEGFQSMVDALGGVDICVKEDVSDPKTHLDLKAGTHHLAGRDALRFVQSRKGFGDGSDIGRIGRQQDFMSAVAREATDTKLLLRPDRLLGFLDAATKSLTTDKELGSIKALSDLALQVRDLKPDQINFVTVPVRAYPSDPNRVEWTDDAEALWKAMRNDEPLPGTEPEPTESGSSTTPPPPVPTVKPDQLSVKVINSSGVSGLAVQASEALAVQGFEISGRGNGTVGKIEGVVIRHPLDQAEAAVTLQAAFPGSKLEADDSLTNGFQVELGAGAPSVVEVPNRLGSDPLPDQPIVATSDGSGSKPSLKARVASDESCT